MLSKVFGIMETTEVQLTPQALTRLRVTTLLSFLVIPIYGAVELLDVSGGARTTLIALGVISALAMLYSFTTRLANRLWTPEKYLDENEIERKRRSMSLTFQVLTGVLAVLLLYMSFTAQYGSNAVMSINAIVFIMASLFFMSFSFQIAAAAWMIKPLNDSGAKPVAADKRYMVLVAVFIVITGLAYAARMFS